MFSNKVDHYYGEKSGNKYHGVGMLISIQAKCSSLKIGLFQNNWLRQGQSYELYKIGSSTNEYYFEGSFDGYGTLEYGLELKTQFGSLIAVVNRQRSLND